MTAAATKPTTMPVVFDQIPAELQTLDRWVLWRWELREDTKGRLKWTKPPHQPNGRYARSDTPSTWSTFADARRAFEAGGFDGVGFALDEDDDLAGVDLDHCVEDGVADPWALAVAERIASYTEVSPSGTGLRIIVHAKLPPGGRKRGNVECYETGRYLTITGHKLAPAPTTIEHRQEQIDAFHAEHFPAPEQTSKATTNGSAGHLTDSQVLDLIRGSKQAAKFEALYRGDDTLHNGDTSAGTSRSSRSWRSIPKMRRSSTGCSKARAARVPSGRPSAVTPRTAPGRSRRRSPTSTTPTPRRRNPPRSTRRTSTSPHPLRRRRHRPVSHRAPTSK